MDIARVFDHNRRNLDMLREQEFVKYNIPIFIINKEIILICNFNTEISKCLRNKSY